MALSKKDFIRNSRAHHGSKFDYSKIEIKGAHDKVEIICPKHGSFWQAPHSHQNGIGCPKCSACRDTESFIERAVGKFGSRYDYSKVKYVTSQLKVKIICPEHGVFEVTPARHLFGKGHCPECTRPSVAKSTKEFVEKCRNTHGRKYLYHKVNYAGSQKKVEIVCRKHGPFLQKAYDHMCGQGCPKCNKSFFSDSTKDFIRRAKKVHGNEYTYDKTEYASSNRRVVITCKKHGDFLQTPFSHLKGHKCKKCVMVCDLGGFIAKASEVHSGRYSYEKSVYVSNNRNIVITCPEHGDFSQTVNSHLCGCGCPACKSLGYSRIAIEWIESEAKRRHMKNVWHATNGGETRIPGTRWLVDGYHKPTNTVFEFHGDAFHGNPKVYKGSDRPNPYRPNVTARELYKATMKREKKLVAMGYRVVSMWESDYRQSRKSKN